MQESRLEDNEEGGMLALQMIDIYYLMGWLKPATRHRRGRERRVGETPEIGCAETPRFLSALLLCFLAWTASPTPAGAAAAEPSPALADLAWMAGCWTGEEGGTLTEECWLLPGGGILLGMHRDVRASGKSFFEFLRIEAVGDSAVYWGSPAGRPATPFGLVEKGPRRVVFANPAHDFPQRIIYWRTDDGLLHARVEGTVRGTLRQEEWHWRSGGMPGSKD
jgi:hypothetical protein